MNAVGVQVFARAGELRDANGVLRTGNGEPLNDAPPRSLAPRRLVESEDPVVRSTRTHPRCASAQASLLLSEI